MKGLFLKRHGKFFITKIDLPVLLAFALFAGLIFFYLIPGFEKAMMESKRVLIREITSTTYTLLEYYHGLEANGTLEPDAAKSQAREAISNIRYGPELKDYFWITDQHPHMIMHPYRPELNGKDLTDFQDSKGKTIFVEFVNAVSFTGESYVDYMWQWNDDSTRVVPKLSYVKLFKPWGWIIGTGIYTEDVRLEILRMEFRALMISGIIGMIIIILLIAISRQSHRMEEKRNQAEEEVKKSRELYRTLAEASSEGALIWSEHGLQANKTMISWLGHTEEELHSRTIQEVFESPEVDFLTDAKSLYEELSTRRFVEGTLIAKSGNRINAHADFSRILMGDMKAVLLVARPVKRTTVQPDLSPQNELLDGIGTGFFRTTFGRKNRFIHASRPTLEILGFDDFQELYSHTIESFFAQPDQLKAFKSSLAARENVSRQPVLLKRNDGVALWVLVSAIVVESESKEVWCEGTIELLSVSIIDQNMEWADLHEYSASYIMKCPVSSIMRPVVEVLDTLSAGHALTIMKENHTDFLMVTDKTGEPLGTIDIKSIGFRLAEGGSPETEIFRWMSSPPSLIRLNASVNEAFSRMHGSQNKCLLVTKDEKTITGMVTHLELSDAFFTAPRLLLEAIGKAGSATALRQVFLDVRKMAVTMLLGRADPYAVSVFLSAIADAISQRTISLCTENAGIPPCRFAFLQTGSAGRREQTLSTDQDNAIIFEDCSGVQLRNAESYFLHLGKKVNEMLSMIGYRLCQGNNMAGNPQWCQPLDRWKKYFSDWIRTPGPSELLEVSIFFDFRYCYGDNHLADELREYLQTKLRTNDIFFHHMTMAWKQFSPTSSMIAGGTLDIKKLLMPLTGMIRLYALRYKISGYSTIDRIIELQSGKLLDYLLLRDTLRAWKDLTAIRLMHQADCIGKGIEPDNLIDLRLTDREFQGYGEQAITAINNLMLKAGRDFYTETI